MRRITEITKRDILDLFRNGLKQDNPFGDAFVLKYEFRGRLEEIDFLKRLYDLQQMPSYDPRYENAEGDIYQHTINNDDWPSCWVFEDERFSLLDGDDECYLKFLCEIFHPAVRNEDWSWQEFLTRINELLKEDGYILYVSGQMSGREVYSWKFYQLEKFMPFSQRHGSQIQERRLKFAISKKVRYQLLQLLKQYDEPYQTRDETNWSYNTSVGEQAFYELAQFYTPKCYDRKNKYSETSNLDDFIARTSPYCVLDMVEIFGRQTLSPKQYVTDLNLFFRTLNLQFKMIDGHIELLPSQAIKADLSVVPEAGIKELIQEASTYYNNGNLQIAVEKLWDALERLKTYHEDLNKKDSVNKIVNDMGCNIDEYVELFGDEFKALTEIGNKFRIRHHEMSKIEIADNRHLEYFYKRCLSLITTVVLFIK